MTYVVYHKDTTRFLTNHPKVKTDKTSFATAASAKAAITREVNNGAIVASDFLIAGKMHFYESIEKTKVVTSIAPGNGAKVEIKANTPLCCDPSSETYWSM